MSQNDTNASVINRQNNSSSENDSYSSVAFGIVTIPIVIVGFIGCILFLFVLYKDTKQRHSVRACFLNLCLSSLFFCIFSGPFQILTYITQDRNFLADPANDFWCQFSAFTNVALIYVVVLCHAAIAVNRYCVIIFYKRVRILKSKILLSILLVSPWFITIVIYIFPLFHLGASYGFGGNPVYKCSFQKREKAFLMASRAITTGSAVILICASYLAIWVKVTMNSRRPNCVGIDCIPPAAPKTLRQINKEVRVAKSTFITCLVFIIFFLPSTVQAFVIKNPANLQLVPGLTLILMQQIGIAISPWLPILLSESWRNMLRLKLFTSGKQSSTVGTAPIFLLNHKPTASSDQFKKTGIIEAPGS
ncbi:hypothetical protein BV898_00686 [Hypsibius exemplaris]|uniref:G-protein coupled receptors family 1 profile domain-containing protein n=1 Tax=Hypsibius exemplaris TaxID=2072580 RepID=A0A1W0XED3_HYPEX|nr:hypothetical protein BV898_00686 [Hypsibius exemplaris]